MEVRKSKLSFKGAPILNQRKKEKPVTEAIPSEKIPIDEPLWTFAERLCDLQGPLHLLQWRDGRVYTFRFDEQAHMTRRPLLSDRPTESPQEALQLLQQVEPSEREDIILGQWMTAIQEKTPEQPGLFGLKTSFGKYLSSDAIGKVFIEREAMGPSEEWLPIKIDSKEEKQAAEADSCALPSIVQFAFRSKLGKYLSFDPIKLNQFRADSEQIGEQETFLIRVQSQKRRANRLVYDGQSATTATKEVDLEKYEETLMRKYQSYGWHAQKEDSKDLYNAQKRGQVHEALLDRRVKAKTDKFCK